MISFGSNLGSRDCLTTEAARIIAQSPLVDDFFASRLYETPPIGGPSGQEPFLNAVAAFETSGSARDILAMLQETEQKLGRQRKRRWDARSIDLDVVLHGELMGGGTGLIVPHPRYTARQFVLQPACDVAANYRDPRFGWTLSELTEHLSHATPSMALVGGSESMRLELCDRLSRDHQIQTIIEQSDTLPCSASQQTPPPRVHFDADSREDQNNPQANENIGRKTLSGRPWISAFVPELPIAAKGAQNGAERVSQGQSYGDEFPRLIGRLQSTSVETRWPAPHQMWPSGWNWPEYRLEIDDMDWAVSELVSALDSMQCPVKPITLDGNWWV